MNLDLNALINTANTDRGDSLTDPDEGVDTKQTPNAKTEPSKTQAALAEEPAHPEADGFGIVMPRTINAAPATAKPATTQTKTPSNPATTTAPATGPTPSQEAAAQTGASEPLSPALKELVALSKFVEDNNPSDAALKKMVQEWMVKHQSNLPSPSSINSVENIAPKVKKAVETFYKEYAAEQQRRQDAESKGGDQGRSGAPSINEAARDAARSSGEVAEAITGSLLSGAAALTGAVVGAAIGAGKAIGKKAIDKANEYKAKSNQTVNGSSAFGDKAQKKATESTFSATVGEEKIAFNDAIESLNEVRDSAIVVQAAFEKHGINPDDFKAHCIKATSSLSDADAEEVLSAVAVHSGNMKKATNDIHRLNGVAGLAAEYVSELGAKDMTTRFESLKSITEQVGEELNGIPVNDDLLALHQKKGEKTLREALRDEVAVNPEALDELASKTKDTKSNLDELVEKIKDLINKLLSFFQAAKNKGSEATQEQQAETAPRM